MALHSAGCDVLAPPQFTSRLYCCNFFGCAVLSRHVIPVARDDWCCGFWGCSTASVCPPDCSPGIPSQGPTGTSAVKLLSKPLQGLKLAFKLVCFLPFHAVVEDTGMETKPGPDDSSVGLQLCRRRPPRRLPLALCHCRISLLRMRTLKEPSSPIDGPSYDRGTVLLTDVFTRTMLARKSNSLPQ